MIDIIIRDCGYGEWLPIIVVTDTGKELYRGKRHRDSEMAFASAQNAWESGSTGNIAEFKQEHGL